MGQKTAPIYFCNNFVKTYYSEIIIGTYSDKFGTKRHRIRQSLLKHVFQYGACSLPMSRFFTFNVTTIVSNM